MSREHHKAYIESYTVTDAATMAYIRVQWQLFNFSRILLKYTNENGVIWLAEPLHTI